MRSLWGRKAPRLAQDFFQKGRIHFQVLRDDVQAEEVTIDPAATHGILIAQLVLRAGQFEQPDSLGFLPIITEHNRMILLCCKAAKLQELTLMDSSCMDLTQLEDSIVQGLTVSVLPEILPWNTSDIV